MVRYEVQRDGTVLLYSWNTSDDFNSLSDESDEENVRETFLDLLDPLRSRFCFYCGDAKELGQALCESQATLCPDHSCRRHSGDTKKTHRQIVCSHCFYWLRSLDSTCRGKRQDCTLPDCEEANSAQDARAICAGDPVCRDGFFVYVLGTGYVGMTYIPSRRQFQHMQETDLRRYMSARADQIKEPQKYFKVSMEGRDTKEKWMDYVSHHWDNVVKRDPGDDGFRRIKWLSVPLHSRWAAYRCEWSLRQLLHYPLDQFSSIVEQLLDMSSLPKVSFESGSVRYNFESHRLALGLTWVLDYNLISSQVVPISHYELCRLDPDTQEYVEVFRGKEASFDGELHKEILGLWRARVVNVDGIPGPWSSFRLSEDDISGAVQGCFRRITVSAQLSEPFDRTVVVSWDMAKLVPGASFEVKRLGSDGSSVIFDVGAVSVWVDDTIRYCAGTKTTYTYSIRPVLDGLPGLWKDGEDSSVFDIDRSILVVGDRVKLKGPGYSGRIVRIDKNHVYVDLDGYYRYTGRRRDFSPLAE